MRHIIVIGNGMVGYKFCEKFVNHSAYQDFHITVLGEEIRPAYDRVHLSEYFSGTTVEALSLAPKEWYQEHRIELKLGELVSQIDPSQQTIYTHKGNQLTYDVLIIATGSVPFVPTISGTGKSGVFVYRTIEDLEAILAYGKKIGSGAKAAVLGGGLLGLEAAKALKDIQLDTHVVEFAPRLMPRQLDNAGASMLKNSIESMGIKIHLSKNTTNIAGENAIECLEFADQSSLDVKMLVISAGIRPRDELAKACDIAVGPRGGIIVNEQMQTSNPNIYAIGEVALYKGMTYGLVAPGYEMAEVAMRNIVGESLNMSQEVDMSTQLKLIGVEVGSFGDALGTTINAREIHFEDKRNGIYKRINISDDGKQLLGGILIGDTSDYNMLLQIMQNGLSLPHQPEDLILGSRSEGGSLMGSILDLPDSAQICSCENVSKGVVFDAVKHQNCETYGAIKSCTKAGTGCGGCAPMVKDLLTETMKSMGKTIKKVICEHFAYSRRELFDLIKIKNIRTYDEALELIGKGGGCETCKPALASVFATVYNETATAQPTIQDTNDRYLANIQKNGSYSVIPRIPGGEITPEKLGVIAHVAQKYGLYTKITGGQRIDLFGARVDQLPAIWEELIEAGFESGHAYGKALRTVKSCVGSTWCRFGMHDSVSFAIEVEERYRGIRAPHKLKGGVSGCIRECAEARGKDFGIIATEKGWNLYVCGNGGAKPKHAQLLASDIDKETCVKYLDRFLMFYIKTADPLTRTAPWLEKLEGGMDYLKAVVVEDRLGVGEQLEKDMQFMVNTYKCEWKEVVTNPELRKRFTHFVNSDGTDEQMKWQELRNQKIPAAWG